MALAVTAGLLSARAQAAAGDLDPTFSGDGKQTTGFGVVGVRAGATATVRQPDGKIIAVGWVYSTSWSDYDYYDFALARYNPNGSLDKTFSDDGLQRTEFGDARANAVALQPNGKIVVVGRGIGNGGYDFAIARYKPNGSLDTSFSGDGKKTTAFAGYDSANGVAIQPDGKIVVVGRTGTGDFALVRYNPNGSLDTTFSGDGRQTTDFGGSDDARGVVLQDDGKIVVAGAASGDFALARYDPSGSLDLTFSSDGIETTDFFGHADEANAVALQGDGKIVAAGETSGAAGGDFALARYNADGSLDSTFSGDGKRVTDFNGGEDAANAVALGTDGKIVAVGEAFVNDPDFALARYNPNGSLDTTFSGDGRQTTDLGGSERAGGVALEPDGRIVAAGEGGPHLTTFALARYDANGPPDPTFSRDGTLITSFGSSDRATGVAIQADGKAVVVGATGAGGFGIVRYWLKGSLDPTFSGDGRQTLLYEGVEQANGVALQSDGKIVVVGGGNGFVLARYNPNGALDPTFSGDGTQRTYLNGSSGAAAVAIQSDDKIVAVGDAPPSGSGYTAFAVVRYRRNGSLDPTFSGDGIQKTDFSNGGRASAVALQPDGKIVAVGDAGGDFALARYNPNGSLDPTFSGDGKQTTPFAFHQGAVGVALQDDGKIVVVGNEAVARYNPNGSLDQSFSGDGTQDTGFWVTGVAIQGDGRIVVVGQAATGGGDFGVARYKPNGSLDTTFAGDGRQETDFGGFDAANAVALQADGKIIAVGFGPGLTPTSDFAVARYLAG